jgi:hypothetical protein
MFIKLGYEECVMSDNRIIAEMDRSFFAAVVLSVLSLLVSIISILDEDVMFFAIFLIPFFAFGFYALWKWDKVKNASSYRRRDEENRKARRFLSRRTLRQFSRKKRIGFAVSIISFVLSIVFISGEEFMLFGLFVIIGASSAVVASISGKYLDDPVSYLRDQRTRYDYPGGYKGNAHKNLLVSTIIFFVLFVILEYNLEFENMVDWWISGFVGVIGLILFFITIAFWSRKLAKSPKY